MKKIKYHIVKFIFSVIGFFRVLFKFKKGHKYYGGIQPNTESIYRGNRTFYETINGVEKNFGVMFYNTRNKQYKYWELGLFKWRENKDIKVED